MLNINVNVNITLCFPICRPFNANQTTNHQPPTTNY